MDLTNREFTIADQITRGYTEAEIADNLYISQSTVHNHAYNIRKKLNARCAVDIARKFILSLENPKAYFLSLLFLIIQMHSIFNISNNDMRVFKKGAKRVTKVSRKTS